MPPPGVHQWTKPSFYGFQRPGSNNRRSSGRGGIITMVSTHLGSPSFPEVTSSWRHFGFAVLPWPLRGLLWGTNANETLVPYETHLLASEIVIDHLQDLDLGTRDVRAMLDELADFTALTLSDPAVVFCGTAEETHEDRQQRKGCPPSR